MSAQFDVSTYLAAWKAAGKWVDSPLPRAFLLTRGIPIDLPPPKNAVYIAAVGGEASYVGSTTRGIAVRLREHVRIRNRAHWEELWIIPMREEVPRFSVLLAEERVGSVVLPTENIRRPGR